MSLTDRYGLTLSTASAGAARNYQDGMDKLLSYGLGADQSFAAAVANDEGFALAHAGAALFSMFQGDGASAKAAIERARGLTAVRHAASDSTSRRSRRSPAARRRAAWR